MNKLNFLQPDKNNLNTYLYTGVNLVALSIFIVFLNSFFNKDIISFLPGSISFFLPLILGFIGLHLIRILLETQKTYVQVVVLVGPILKFGLTDLCMGCTQMLSSGELTCHL